MTLMVLFEEDINYFLMTPDNANVVGENAVYRLSKRVNKDTSIGQWLIENRILPKFTSLNNSEKLMCKYIVYADLSDIQQTEYTLKFSYT